VALSLTELSIFIYAWSYFYMAYCIFCTSVLYSLCIFIPLVYIRPVQFFSSWPSIWMICAPLNVYSYIPSLQCLFVGFANRLASVPLSITVRFRPSYRYRYNNRNVTTPVL